MIGKLTRLVEHHFGTSGLGTRGPVGTASGLGASGGGIWTIFWDILGSLLSLSCVAWGVESNGEEPN